MTGRRSLHPEPPRARPSVAPERMPTGAFNLPTPPAEADEPADAGASASGFIPPRLGQALPRTRLAHPGSDPAAQWLNSLVRALRGIHLYASNNVRRKDFLDQTVKQLDVVLKSVAKLELTIFPDRILHQRDVVHVNADPVEGLPNLFYMNGVRRIVIERDFDRIELFRFIGALVTDFTAPENRHEDLVSVVERLGLTHVVLLGEDKPKASPPKASEPARPPKPAALPEEHAAVRLPTSAMQALSSEEDATRLPTSAFKALPEEDAPIRLATGAFKAIAEEDTPLRLATGAFRAVVESEDGAGRMSSDVLRAMTADLAPTPEPAAGDFAFSLSAPAGLPSTERRREVTDVTEAMTVRWANPEATIDDAELSDTERGDAKAAKRRGTSVSKKDAKPRSRSRVSQTKKRPTK